MGAPFGRDLPGWGLASERFELALLQTESRSLAALVMTRAAISN